MIKSRDIAKFIIIGIFTMNIFMMMIPILEEDFSESDHFFATFLRGLNYKPRKPIKYHHIPTLTDKATHTQNGMTFGGINAKISAYYVPGWADSRWQYRKNITILSSKVSADLTNFPVLIDIYDSALQKDAQASGNDIIFTDNSGSILDHEIELYERVYNSSHAHLVAWVKANITSTQDTILSMYYGNPTAEDQENSVGVWSEYVGVWHLSEASGNAKDATSFDTDGVASSMNYQQPGVLGYGMEWTSSSSSLNMGNPTDGHLDFGTGDFTISLWVRVDQDIGWEWILSKGAQFSSDIGYGLISDNTPVSNWRAITRDPTLVEASPSSFNLGEWNYITCKLDRGTDLLYIYGNGTEDDTADASGLGNIDNAKSLRLPMSASYYFDGWIDELRLTNLSRSGAWIQTEYNNQNDPSNFYTIGVRENSPDWAFNSFKYRKKITINAAKISSDLTDFPVFIDLYDTDLHDSAKILANGNDLVFTTASGTKLDHEIELFDQVFNTTHAHLVAWVRVPSLSSISDTVILMHYGNPTINNQENPEGVWDTDFMGVWHLSESPSGTVGEITDSTSNNNDGYTVGSMNATNLVESQVGDGLDLDGIDDMIIINDSTSLDSINDAGTISFWINSFNSSDGDYQRIMVSSNTFPDRTSGLEIALQGDGDLFFYPCEENAVNYNLATDPLTSKSWDYVTFTMEFTTKTVDLYINGVSLPFTIENVPDNWTQLAIIDDWLWGGDSVHFKHLTGLFDEIRVSDTVRSAAWIATEYNNQNDPDSFYTIETVEENPRGLVGPSEALWYSPDWIYRNKLTIDPTKVGIDPYYKQITITTGSSSLPSGFSVSLTLDHESLVNSGKSRIDGDDIRIKYNNSGEMIELDRVLDPSSSWNLNSTKIWFITQSVIPASSSNYDYYLYYGNIFTGSPASNVSNVFFFYDGFESGNLSGWDGYSEGSAGDSISASTDQAYTGTYSAKCVMDTVYSPQAMIFEDIPDEINVRAKVPIYLDPSLSITDRITVMQYLLPGWQNLISVTIDEDMTLYMWNAVAGEAYGYGVGNTISTGTWHTLELQAKISDTAGEARLWLDNSLEIEATGINLSTGVIDRFAAGIYWAGDNEPNTLYIDDIYLRLGVDNEPTIGLGTEVSQILNNFPVLINSTIDNWKDTSNGGYVSQTDGGDFLFTTSDGITKLAHEIEKYDPTTGELVAWVNVPSISFGLATDIFVYYGNTTTTDQWNTSGTWNSDYVGVWHLKEDASGTGTLGLYKDSTLNSNDGDDYVSDTLKTGRINGGQGFDGTDDYIDMGNATTLDIVSGDFTLEAWVRLDAKDGDSDIISKACDGVTVRSFELRYDIGEDYWTFNAYDSSWQYAKFTQENPELGKWYHLVAVRDGNTIKIYVDGVEGAVTDILGTMDDSSAFSLLIGRLIDPSDPRYFNGNIDEVRVSTAVRNSDWIITQYNNQKDPNSFYYIDNCEYYFWWADTSFTKRKDILIDHTQFGPTEEDELIDFPFLLELYDSDLKTDVQNDGADILFFDMEGRKLDYEIEIFNQTYNITHAQLLVWIELPVLKLDCDTKISMYYGNNQLPSQENPTGVWREDYKGVWHLSEDPSGSAPQIEDSTVNNNHGSTSNLDTDDQISGQVDGSLDFDNNQDHVDCGNHTSLNTGTGDLSLSLWFNYDAVTMGPMAGKGAILGGIRYYIAITTPAGLIMGQIDDNTVAKSISSVSTYGDDLWHHVVLVKDGNFLHLYIDGVESPNSPIDITGYGTLDNVHSFYMNTLPSDNSGILTTWSSVKLDEVRISTNAKTADWIQAEFKNQDNPTIFSSVSSEFIFDESPPIIDNFGVDDLGTGLGEFWAKVSDDSGVNGVKITINNTEYTMSYNNTHWIYELSVSYQGYYEYLITNASDILGNYRSINSSQKSHTFNYDTVNPSVDDWEYFDSIGPYGTFKANVSDSWGTIHTVILNVTYAGGVNQNDLWSSMTLTASGYMNDTLNLPSGTIKFVVTVNDTAGNSFTSAEHQGLIPSTNQAPSAENITLSRSDTAILLPIYSNDTLYLDYDYFDPESDPESGTEIRWYKNGIYQATYDDQDWIPSSALVKGDYWNVTIKPSDGEEFGALSNSSTIIIQNTPPQATSVVITPSSPITSSTLSVSYTYSDYDSDSQNIGNRQVRWYKDGVLQTTQNDSLSIASGLTSKGEEWYYTLRVHDGTNYSTWITSTSVIIANSVPSATSVEITPASPLTTDTLNASYYFTDPDGDSESGSLIRWYKNGVLQSALNNSVIVDFSLTLKGENWYFTVVPSDGVGYGTLKQAVTIVIGNTAPVASNLDLSPSNPITGNDLTAGYDYNDPDLDSESGTQIIWYKDGVLQGALNGSNEVQAGNTSKGEIWHFKVHPSDGTDDGLWYSCPVNVTIGNTAPTVSNLAINPSSPDSIDDISVSYDYFDADLDPETGTEILWYMNGSLQGQLNDSILVQAGNLTKGQIWHVKVRVYDGTTYSTWLDLLSNTTIKNSPPTASDVRLNGFNGPTQISDDDDLIGSYVYSDADSDPQVNASREIYWYKKGQDESTFSLQPLLNHTLAVDSENTIVGDTWYFIIRVYDGTNYSTSESSPSVSIGVPPNSPPEALFLNITPALPVSTDNLFINWTFIDSDTGDNESDSMYYWYRNGILMPDYNGLQTLPAFSTAKGDIWHVKVRPRDGIDFGQLASVPLNVTIGNIAPEVNSLQISPTSPISENDLTISYIFTDIDGDGESGSNIIWYLNGVLQGSLNDSTSISTANTIKGQQWHFKVSPSDGTDFGVWISCPLNVTIGNSKPSASSLTITPTDPKTGNDLTASYAFTDPDTIAGDTEGVSLIRWFKNGIEQTIYENLTNIPSSATQKDENWWFEVTPFDGTDYGNVKISIVRTIQNTAPTASTLVFNPSNPKKNVDLSVSYVYDDIDSDSETSTIILWFRNGLPQETYNDLKTIDGAILVKEEQWNVSIRVSDGTDLASWLNGSIFITNTAPIIAADSAEIIEPSLGLITTSSLVATWSTYDADGDTIIDYKITWENRSGGSFVEQSILENLTEVPAIYTQKNQEWRFKIQIFDGVAWSLLINSFVSDIKNSEPIIENITLSGGQTTTDPITVSYDFQDADGDPDFSDITWAIFHITPPFIFQPGTTTLSGSEFTAGDLVWVEITPDDDDSSTGTGDSIDTSRQSGAGKQIQVGNSAPQINTTLSLPTVLADHPDGSQLYSAGYSLFANYSTLVYDIDSDESPSIFDVTVVNDENLLYQNISVIFGAQYRWYKFNPGMGWELQSDLTKSFVDSYYLRRDDQWMVSIRPRDNYGYYGNWVNSTSITIGNSYPQVLGFQWVDEYPITTDDLFFAFNYFDYDQDSLVVNETLVLWYKNGVLISGTENKTSLASQFFHKGDQISVIIRPSDGTNWAGRNYTSIEFVGLLLIVNSPPTASNIALTPSAAYTTDILTLNWTFHDADGDSQSSNYLIEWRRSGVVVPELENLTKVESSYITKGETWQARIWVFDETDYSLIGYYSNNNTVVVIRNSPMEIISLQFDGIMNQTTTADSDLLINWITNDLDNDGQVDYRISWYHDNGSGTYVYRGDYGDHSYSIQTIDLRKSHLWYCNVSVYDGEDWSINNTSSIIYIINAAPQISNLQFVFDSVNSQVEPDIRIDEFYVEDEDLVIAFNYIDIDNDVTQTQIQWFKILNGSIYEIFGFENASYIPASELSLGELWFCQVTAFDGFSSGTVLNSSMIPIYSRSTCYSYTVIPDRSSEGRYSVIISISDYSFEVTEVHLNIIYFDNTSEAWIASHSGGDNWTVSLWLENLDYLNTNLTMIVKSSTIVLETDFEIYSLYTFIMSLEDEAPPRVLDAFFDPNDVNNPTNLTFYAIVQEFGTGVNQIELSYYFSLVNASEGYGANAKQITTNQVYMSLNHYNSTGEYYLYEVTVNFVHNKTDRDIIYWISTTDNAGNTNPLAFDIRNDPQRIKEQRFVYNPLGLPEWVLLVAGLVIVAIFMGAVVYVKFIRKPELVGLDKELVLSRINEVSDQEVLESLDQHTIGIVISFFDQRHGPIPIIVVPDILKDNFSKLVELSDRSFSGTGFSDDFENEIPSSYDFVLDHGVRTSILSFGFALKRPEARGGQENLTLNILIHHDLFPLVQSFQKSIQQKTHEIHHTMADETIETELIGQMTIELRKYLSMIILSYKMIYSTTDLLEED